MSKQELINFLELNYDLGDITGIEKLSGGVSNVNYRIKSSPTDFVARLCSFEPENQVSLMIPFLEYAEEVNYPAARLVKTKNRKAHGRFNGSPIIVTTFINGRPGNSVDITDAHISNLAKSLARLHSLDWSPESNPKTLHPGYILGVYRQFPPEHLTADFDGVDELKNSLKNQFKYFSSDDFLQLYDSLPVGLVHGDMIPGNVMFSEAGEVEAFVDLEEVGYAVMLLDVARVINNWFFDNSIPNMNKVNLFIKSYSEVRQFEDGELESLPIMMKFIAFKHSVYAQKMLIQGRISNIDEFDDYQILNYLTNNDFKTI